MIMYYSMNIYMKIGNEKFDNIVFTFYLQFFAWTNLNVTFCNCLNKALLKRFRMSDIDKCSFDIVIYLFLQVIFEVLFNDLLFSQDWIQNEIRYIIHDRDLYLYILLGYRMPKNIK